MTPRPLQESARRRAKRRSPTRGAPSTVKNAGDGMRSLVGRNYQDRGMRINPHALLRWFALVLILALGLAALRIDLIRIRYGVAAVLAEEVQLREEGRELVVRQRRLRDPARLAERAKELGFVRPETVVALADVTEVDPTRVKEEGTRKRDGAPGDRRLGQPMRTAAAARVRGERPTR